MDGQTVAAIIAGATLATFGAMHLIATIMDRIDGVTE